MCPAPSRRSTSCTASAVSAARVCGCHWSDRRSGRPRSSRTSSRWSPVSPAPISRTSAPTATPPPAAPCRRCTAPLDERSHALNANERARVCPTEETSMSTPIAAPEPLAQGTLRVTPIGGLGEIGRNMTAFEYDGKILIVDCGVLFPEEHQPGVDLILPDFSPIKDRLDDIVGVVLTHGHEDHIGGVPYLLRLKADIPLIGSGLTLALVEAKLKEHRIKPFTLTVKEGQEERVGP